MSTGKSRFCTWVLGGLILTLFFVFPLYAQPAEPFALHDGDRVVWVGDGLIERAQRYGYLELALTTRYPDRTVVFRNVGWSGDTVFGEARDHYTNPPTAFDHLVEQITSPRPTVIVLGYGSTLAYDGPTALPSFTDGYHRLLDTLATTGARCVLLTPLPLEARASPHPEVASLNENLRRVRDGVGQVAAERGCTFIDLFTPMQQRFQQGGVPLTAHGLHLNATGYRILAVMLAEALIGAMPSTALTIDLDAGTAAGGPLQGAVERNDGSYTFSLLPTTLAHSRRLSITGLPQGTYVLRADDQVLHTATTSDWAEGLLVEHPDEQARIDALRRLIIEKDQLYFRQYRPQNETYLVGFRKYEQGQNADELDQLDPLIGEMENEIGRLRVPPVLTFTLSRE